ncbi:MAG: hypothetical protein QM503_08210 [Bacteroidota bacterium]
MKSASYIIIIVLVAILLLQRECNTSTESYDCNHLVEVVTDTIYDTVEILSVQYVPSISYIDTGSVVWKYHKIDTALILSNYFSKYYYQDTILNDTVGLIILRDTITQNRISYRNPSISIYPRLIKQTTLLKQVTQPKLKLFLGLGLGGNMSHFSLSPSLMLITKKQTSYSLSYDLLNNDVNFTMYWKLKFR